MIKDISGVRFAGGCVQTNTPFQLKLDEKKRSCLLFGRNGSGKTTLSRAFAKASGQEIEKIPNAAFISLDGTDVVLSPEEQSRVVVFNEDYIEQNVRFKNSGLDTIVMLGNMGSLEDQISAAQSAVNQAQDTFEQQKALLKKYDNDKDVVSPKKYIKEMMDALKGNDSWASRDGKLRGNTIKSKVNDTTYRKFINLSPQKTKEELLIAFSELQKKLQEVESGKSKITATVKSDIALTFDREYVSELLRKKIEHPELSAREKYLLELSKKPPVQGDWLSLIRTNIQKSDVTMCPFCLQDVSGDHKHDLIQSIQKLLNKDAENHKRELGGCILTPYTFDTTPFQLLGDEVIASVHNALDEVNHCVEQINEMVRCKMQNIYTPVSEDIPNIEAKFDVYIHTLVKLESARDEHNKTAANPERIKAEMHEINNEIAYYDVITIYRSFKKQSKAMEVEKAKCQEFEKDLKKKKAELANLEAQRKNISIAINMINDSFQYIFFAKDRLRIECVDNAYRLYSRGRAIKPADVSVGEKNIIALCYFFTQILNNQNPSVAYRQDYFLFLDDPISSFDMENRIGILSYLKFELGKFMCGNPETKVLVATHDMATYYDLQKIFDELLQMCIIKYPPKKGKRYLQFEVSKNTLAEIPEKPHRHEYSVLMGKIFDYANDDTSVDEMSIGNCIRRVMEAFGTFEYKEGIEGLSTKKQILNELQDDRYKSYFENLMYRLVLNGGSHFQDQVRSLNDMNFFEMISPSEKKRTAKDVLCLIYCLHPSHVLSHLGKEKRPNAKATLDDWCQKILDNSLCT